MLSDSADFALGSVVFVDGGSDAYFRTDEWPRPVPCGGYRLTCGGHASSSRGAVRKARAALLAVVAATTLMGCTGKTRSPEGIGQGRGSADHRISYDDLLNQKQISRSVSLSVGDTLTGEARLEHLHRVPVGREDVDLRPEGDHPARPPDGGVVDRAIPARRAARCGELKATAPGNSTVSTTYGRPRPGGRRTFLGVLGERHGELRRPRPGASQLS